MPQNPLPARLNGPWVSLLTLVLVVGILYTGKQVLLPMALGIVLAFVLTPLVRQFDRMHLPRFLGVALTMVLALSAVLLKRLGVEVARPLAPDFPTLGDVDSVEALDAYQAAKRAHRSASRGEVTKA